MPVMRKNAPDAENAVQTFSHTRTYALYNNSLSALHSIRFCDNGLCLPFLALHHVSAGDVASFVRCWR